MQIRLNLNSKIVFIPWKYYNALYKKMQSDIAVYIKYKIRY